MSELSYKELQEKGVFDIPFKAFKFMESQQQEINELKKRIEDTEKWIEENKKYTAIGHWEGWTDEQYVDADDLLDILKGESYVF